VDGRGRCSMVAHNAQLPTVISELMSSPSPSHFCSIHSRSLAVLPPPEISTVPVYLYPPNFTQSLI
jgi:hypothetical protein